MRLLRQGDEWYFRMDAQSAITSRAEPPGCGNSAHSIYPALFATGSPEFPLEVSNQHEGPSFNRALPQEMP